MNRPCCEDDNANQGRGCAHRRAARLAARGKSRIVFIGSVAFMFLCLLLYAFAAWPFRIIDKWRKN